MLNLHLAIPEIAEIQTLYVLQTGLEGNIKAFSTRRYYSCYNMEEGRPAVTTPADGETKIDYCMQVEIH